MDFVLRAIVPLFFASVVASCAATSDLPTSGASASGMGSGSISSDKFPSLKNAVGQTRARGVLRRNLESYRGRRGNSSRVITIRGDRGGELISYAKAVKQAADNGSLVRIGGNCDSACTLYLALPPRQLCLLPGASFRFHHPYGGSKKNNRIAAQFMMRTYPNWVRSWLSDHGGLSGNLKALNYDVASQHIGRCDDMKKFWPSI